MTKEKIIEVSCEVCGVDTAGGRIPDNAMAMHLAMYFMRWELDMDPENIGAEFGVGKTAVYEHIDPRKVNERRRFEHPFEKRFNSVALKISGGWSKRDSRVMTNGLTSSD